MPTAERKRLALEQMANSKDFVMNAEFQAKFLDLVQNEFLSRGAFIQRWMDPRRDYNRECGYPETYEITSEKWQDYYERHPIAARVVEIMPSECWQITPDLYEVDDPNVNTPFEQGFKDLAGDLRGVQSYYKPEEEVVHPLWEYCRRLDILSGIGQFGVMLLGYDDGISLNQPVEGWQEPEVGNITWNQEALPFLRELSKHFHITANGELIWNAPTPDEEEQLKKKSKSVPEATNGKKPKEKKVTDKENMQSSEGYLPPEPTGKSMPSPAAFGNVNPQQGKYHDPMDPEALKDIQPQGPEQPEFGDFTTEDQRQQPGMQTAPTGRRRLIYVRVFPEALVQIMRYEQNMASPRFGQPTMYRITLNDPMQNQTGVGLPLSTIEVHYSRVIHAADLGANAGSSEIFAPPRMRPVLNNLIDLQKIYGACGEGYWKNAFATLAAETHPQLGGDVTLDVEAMREQMKKWRDSLDRVLAATGVTWRTISPQLIDPNSYVQNHLTAICIKLGCPLRVFMGSEQGVLAASQDSYSWGLRVQERRKNYLTPRLIVPLIDRLITVGVLPAPQESYMVNWNDEQKLTPQEQASIGGAITGAMATYISGQVDQLIEPVTWMTEVLGWNREKAQSVVDATMEHILKQQEQQAMQGQQMIDPMTGQPMQQDEMGQFIDPNTGEPAPTDEMGKPMVMDPNTGQPMPAQPQSPQESQGPLGAEASEAAQVSQEMDPGVEAPEEQMEPEEEELPTDPDSGLMIDEEAGLALDPETGDVYDIETGEVVGNVNDDEQYADEFDQEQPDQEDGSELETEEPEDGFEDMEGDQELGQEDPMEEAQEPEHQIDPETGRIVNPENGYQLDQETGDIYTPEGELWGNINDEDDQEEME
jgi:hypothetical protein